jgi:hypothetical protein
VVNLVVAAVAAVTNQCANPADELPFFHDSAAYRQSIRDAVPQRKASQISASSQQYLQR